MKKKTKWLIIGLVLAILIISAVLFLGKRGQTDIFIDDTIPRMTVTSTAFDNLGVMPAKHTGRGEDISPAFELSGLVDNAVSIAIIMDDLDVPWKANYTHWVIWNIPASTNIPEGISHGETVPELSGAIQGVAFGRNRYRGPMPPFGTHRYQFHIFVLDAMVDLDNSHGKNELLAAIESHILQYGILTGWYPREDN